MITKARIKRGDYYDSVTLLRVAQGVLKFAGCKDAAVVMGTPANKGLLKDAALMTPEIALTSPDDLIITVRAEDEAIAEAALVEAERLLKTSRASMQQGVGSEQRPRTLTAAMETMSDANIALISVAGRYAAGVALEALARGLHVFLFSDNVSVEEEIALKKIAAEKGLLVMGPDAGTAILNNVALGFSNAVPIGPVGVIGASGTGLQSVTSALARNGVGITQAIGVGGRDLCEAVGGAMMLEGLKALQADAATKVILVVSKPPDKAVAERVLAQIRQSSKPTVVCFLGGDLEAIRAAGAIPAAELESAAQLTTALARGESPPTALGPLVCDDMELKAQAKDLKRYLMPGQRFLRGLFSGGTFCYETQLIFRELIGSVCSNAPLDKRYQLADANRSEMHSVIDLGEDEFTVGRLHPMIDPTLRALRIVQEASDAETAIILLDIVLGYGAHPDPAGAMVKAIQEARLITKKREVLFIASVCGTEDDPQVLSEQERILRDAGVIVLSSNAAATRLAGYILAGAAQKLPVFNQTASKS